MQPNIFLKIPLKVESKLKLENYETKTKEM